MEPTQTASTNDNPASVATDNQANPGPGATANGTVTAPGQADGAAPTGEETFFSGDPRTLPPNLKSVYDAMLKDYRAKTTEAAEIRKASETYREKATQFEQLAANEEFVRQWNEYVEKGGKPPQAADPNAPKADPRIEELAQWKAQTEMRDYVNAFASAKGPEGKPLRPDFDRLNEIMVDDQTSLLRACINLATGKDVKEKVDKGYVLANKLYAQIKEEGFKAASASVRRRANNGTELPTGSVEKGTFAGDPKNMTPKEAVRLAKQRIVVRSE